MDIEKLEEVTRVEVIDKTGRVYVSGIREDLNVELHLQDDGKTLKIFL